MANWKYTLDISKAWEQLHSEEITLQEGVEKIVIEISKLILTLSHSEEDFVVEGLEDISDEFSVLDYDDVTTEDFDFVMEMLYNWADDNLVWIKTFI